jgi:hypothetical protein
MNTVERLDKLTFEVFAEMFDSEVHGQLRSMLAREGVEYLVCYECRDFCSSRFGDRKGLTVGPSCTVKTLEDAAKLTLDTELCSTIKMAVAYTERTN